MEDVGEASFTRTFPEWKIILPSIGYLFFLILSTWSSSRIDYTITINVTYKKSSSSLFPQKLRCCVNHKKMRINRLIGWALNGVEKTGGARGTKISAHNFTEIVFPETRLHNIMDRREEKRRKRKKKTFPLLAFMHPVFSWMGIRCEMEEFVRRLLKFVFQTLSSPHLLFILRYCIQH